MQGLTNCGESGQRPWKPEKVRMAQSERITAWVWGCASWQVGVWSLLSPWRMIFRAENAVALQELDAQVATFDCPSSLLLTTPYLLPLYSVPSNYHDWRAYTAGCAHGLLDIRTRVGLQAEGASRRNTCAAYITHCRLFTGPVRIKTLESHNTKEILLAFLTVYHRLPSYRASPSTSSKKPASIYVPAAPVA